MAKKQKAVLGFTQDAKKTALMQLGYTLYEHKGRINDAPTQIRHLARDLQAGIYLVNLSQRAVVKQLNINASGHKFVYDQASLLNEQFKEAIINELQSDYVYAVKNQDGTFDFMGFLADSPVIKNAIITRLAANSYGSGFYGVQINNSVIGFVTHVYTAFENLLLDLAIYSPVSPFAPFASEIMEHHFTDLTLEAQKFGFSGDAAITLGAMKNGKLVATVVNYPEIDGVEKLFVVAPDMLRLLLNIANPATTASDMIAIKIEAQRIIGAINV